jgi:hypothetical protein
VLITKSTFQSFTFFTSQSFTLPHTHLYQKEESALPGTYKTGENISVGCEALTPVLMNTSIFSDITPCSTCYLLHLNFLIGLFFDPENGGNMLLRNVG